VRLIRFAEGKRTNKYRANSAFAAPIRRTIRCLLIAQDFITVVFYTFRIPPFVATTSRVIVIIRGTGPLTDAVLSR